MSTALILKFLGPTPPECGALPFLCVAGQKCWGSIKNFTMYARADTAQSLSALALPLVLVLGESWLLRKYSEEHFHLFDFLENFVQNWNYCFLKCLAEFINDVIWSYSLLCEVSRWVSLIDSSYWIYFCSCKPCVLWNFIIFSELSNPRTWSSCWNIINMLIAVVTYFHLNIINMLISVVTYFHSNAALLSSFLEP